MNKHERIPIESKGGVTIYGRVIDSNNKMGLYEVFSDYWGSTGAVYHKYSEAETRMKEILDRNKKQQ